MAYLSEFITLNELLPCLVIVAFAAIVQMSVGMGFGMLASPLIALVKPEIVPGCIVLIGFSVAISGAWRERENISAQELKMGIGGRIIGSLIALGILIQINDLRIFLLVFGIVMLIAVTMTASGMRVAFTNTNLFGLSVVSGLMGSITAVGAPPMAIIYHQRPPNVVRPTLNAFFASGCVLAILTLSTSGWFGWIDVVATLLLCPAMILGIYLSRLFANLPARFTSRALLALSGAASLLLIVKSLN
ncbi:MAG: sulfite exporter TauE/SafE family protein [Rhizobiaceae bacterium]|nr:sulfite exporter TauE/SafE family protein [Rhizobiaceae bacterium]